MASNTTVSSGGREILSSFVLNGVAVSTTVNFGGSEFIYSGGIASVTTVSSGGSEQILYGGVASGTFISSGGEETVSSSGTTSDSVIAGGTLNLSAGALVGGTIGFSGASGSLVVGGSAPTNPIGGLISAGDIVDLTQLVFSGGTSAAFDSASDLLTVSEGGSSASLQLASGDYTSVAWIAESDGKTGTDVLVGPPALIPCFCRGTRILTEKGGVAVEDLQNGDPIVTQSDWLRPVKWIGRCSYDGRFIRGNPAVLPIVVTTAALPDRVPHRDLWLSLEHALYFDRILVKTELLLNGMTIWQDTGVETVEYFHLELESHDILLAEGAFAESFIDCDNRGQFHSATEFRALYLRDARPRWAYSAPFIDENALAALRHRPQAGGGAWLADRHRSQSPADRRRAAGRAAPSKGRFPPSAPQGRPCDIHIASRHAIPQQIGINHDTRRLAVSLHRLALRGPGTSVGVEFDDPSLCGLSRDGARVLAALQ